MSLARCGFNPDSVTPTQWGMGSSSAARLDVLLRVALADDDKDAEGEGQRGTQQAQREADINAEARNRKRAPPKRRLRTEG